MKRKALVSLALVLCLLLSSPALAAQAPSPDGPVGLHPDISIELKPDAGTRGSSRFPEPYDTVTIEDGVFTITSEGVTIQLQVPFGWIGLSQDISKQMADYALMNDPMTVLNALIESRISLLAVEPDSNSNIFVFFVADGLSALIGDMDTEEMLAIAQSTYGGEAISIGDKNYMSVLEDDTLIFFTVYKGVRIGYQLLLAGSEATAEETELLTEFVGLAAYL